MFKKRQSSFFRFNRYVGLTGPCRSGRNPSAGRVTANCQYTSLCTNCERICCRRRKKHSIGFTFSLSDAQQVPGRQDFWRHPIRGRNCRYCIQYAGRYTAPHANSIRKNPGQSTKSDFFSCLFKVFAGADHYHPAGPLCRSGKKRMP